MLRTTKLVLIDGNAIMHRAYHAMPNLTAKGGTPINAVYGLVSMLLRIITDLQPTHIAVCFDRPEPTFRKKILESYQAHRPEMEDNLSSQFKKAKKVLSAMRISVFEKAGYEADDVIGTLAHKTLTGDIDEAVIVTGDRDMLQLVDDKENIKLYMPIKGLTEAKLFGEAEVKERMGVTAKQIIDYKALVGDPSDNYPGVRGIGPKTAEKLLKQYGNFDYVYKHLDEIPNKTREILKKGKDGGEMSYTLAKIVTDVPIDIHFNELIHWSTYNPKVEEVFSGFGFKTLKERAKKVAEKKIANEQGNLF